eukprot:scaffold2532_cov79-Skeletonema_menzelii.AAC.42
MISGLLLLTSFLSQECQEVSAFSLSRRASSPASCSIPIKTSKLFTNVDDDDFFDPFLHSPHDYPDGVDNGPEDGSLAAPNGLGAIDEIFESNSSSFGFSSISSSSEPSVSPNTGKINSNDTGDLFDPLLSPHAYPDGISAGPITGVNGRQVINTCNLLQKLMKLVSFKGMLRVMGSHHRQLVGGKRSLELRIWRLQNRRNIITNDKATEIVCVPYFLSPGKHSTVDVPNLIAEAKQVLGEEGLLQHYDYGSINICSSQALGTQLEFMLGGVDELVALALKDGN